MNRWSKRKIILMVAVLYLSISSFSWIMRSNDPSASTFEDVPSDQYAIYKDEDNKLENARFYEYSSATKLTYKHFVFHPPLEKQQMALAITALPISNILKQIQNLNPRLTLLHDGRVLASGGSVTKNKHYEPINNLSIIDPQKKTITKLEGLHVPRHDDGIVQLKDGRVIFIGGETTHAYADEGTDNLTNTVEELDLQTGKTRVIGRILPPRSGMMVEIIGNRDILIVGGWYQRTIMRDDRWWREAEIFHVPPKTEAMKKK